MKIKESKLVSNWNDSVSSVTGGYAGSSKVKDRPLKANGHRMSQKAYAKHLAKQRYIKQLAMEG